MTYLFVTLFLALISYIVYFNVFRAKTIVNSPYNVRQDAFADRIIREALRTETEKFLPRHRSERTEQKTESIRTGQHLPMLSATAMRPQEKADWNPSKTQNF